MNRWINVTSFVHVYVVMGTTTSSAPSQCRAPADPKIFLSQLVLCHPHNSVEYQFLPLFCHGHPLSMHFPLAYHLCSPVRITCACCQFIQRFFCRKIITFFLRFWIGIMIVDTYRFLGELGNSLNLSRLLVGPHQVNFSHRRITKFLQMLLRPW